MTTVAIMANGELPLAINFAADVGKTVPVAMSMSWLTAVYIAIGLMFFGSAATPVDTLISAPAPLMPAIEAVWGRGSAMTTAIEICIVLSLLTSFSSFVFFIGQTVQAIATDKILPSVLARLHPRFETAANASICASVIGFLSTLSFGLIFGESSAQRVLIVCSLLAALISYFFLFGCLSIILTVEADDSVSPNSFTHSQSQSHAHSSMFTMFHVPDKQPAPPNVKVGPVSVPDPATDLLRVPKREWDIRSVAETEVESAIFRTGSGGSGKGSGYCGHDPGLMSFPLGRTGAICGQASVCVSVCGT